MSEWRKRELGELVAAASGYVRTGPFGSQLHAHEYADDPFGIPVVMRKIW
jgi:type I restriction enzyme, S subunit